MGKVILANLHLLMWLAAFGWVWRSHPADTTRSLFLVVAIAGLIAAGLIDHVVTRRYLKHRRA